MTLPVQLNILLTAYSIFSSGSYLHLLLIFFLSDCPSGFVLLKLFIQYGHESIIA